MDEQRDRPGVLEVILRKSRTVKAMASRDVALCVAAWLLIAVASLLIAVLPPGRLLGRLGSNRGAVNLTPAVDDRQHAWTRCIAAAVAVAARNAPFRSDCLPQAIAAAWLCRWLGVPHVVQLGARLATPVGTSSGGLEAHAWVCNEAMTLCGGGDSPKLFGTVACFVHAPRSRSV